MLVSGSVSDVGTGAAGQADAHVPSAAVCESAAGDGSEALELSVDVLLRLDALHSGGDETSSWARGGRVATAMGTA